MVFRHYVFSCELLRCLIEKMFDYKCRNEMAFPQSGFCNGRSNLQPEKMTYYNQSIDRDALKNEYACVFSEYQGVHICIIKPKLSQVNCRKLYFTVISITDAQVGTYVFPHIRHIFFVVESGLPSFAKENSECSNRLGETMSS